MYLLLLNPLGWLQTRYNPNLANEVKNRLREAKNLDRICTPTAIARQTAVGNAAMASGNSAKLAGVNAFLQKCAGQARSSIRAILGEALVIALRLLDGENVPYKDLSKLHQAIRTSPDYKPLLGSKASPTTKSFGGILHVTIPATYLQQIQGTIIQN
jgi:hypothetical protein